MRIICIDLLDGIHYGYVKPWQNYKLYKERVRMKLKQTLITGLTVLLLSTVSVQADHHKGEKAMAISINSANLTWMDCPAVVDPNKMGCKLAVLHGDPAKDNADVIFKTPGGFVIPLHWHSSAERMLLVNGTMELVYDGQEKLVAGPSMYIYGPAKLPHHGKCISAEPCDLFIAFESPVDVNEKHKH